MSAHAVIYPARENFGQAVAEAMATPYVGADCKLYTDGERVAWLPAWMPGWFRILGCAIKHLEDEECAA
ncbi:MAG: hypothetical protein KGP14_00870 [Betaproteobacteria bacterium]|nr:hypothetical protein [Betaproteobacteria bacterium]